MDLKDEILGAYKAYQDSQWGYTVPDTSGGISQNPARWTAEKLRAMLFNGVRDHHEEMWLCGLFMLLERQPGLLMRTPDNGGGQEGPDNRYAAFYADHILDTGFSKNFLKYGRTQGATFWDEANEEDKTIEIFKIKINKKKLSKIVYTILSLGGLRRVPFVFNNLNPGGFTLSAWQGWNIWAVMHAQVVARELVLNPLKHLINLLGTIHSAFNKTQDGKMLTAFRVFVDNDLRRFNPFYLITNWFWRSMLKKHYPGGLGNVLGDFFDPAHYDHPSSVYLMNDCGARIK